MLLIVTTTGFGRMALWRYIAVYAGGIESHNHSIWLLRNNAVFRLCTNSRSFWSFTTHIGAKNVLLVGGACVILGLIGLVFVANFWWAAITLFLAVLGVPLRNEVGHGTVNEWSWDRDAFC